MEKLFTLLSNLSSTRIPVRADLQAHFVTGAIGGYIITYFFDFYTSIAIMASIGFIKELYDWNNEGHTSDIWDWVATTLGGILGSILGEVLWQVIVK